MGMTSNFLDPRNMLFFWAKMGQIGAQNGPKRRVQEVLKVGSGLRPKCGIVLASVDV
jgi:F420-dependent methylenetetrahydromethanopterin dehydrogenase